MPPYNSLPGGTKRHRGKTCKTTVPGIHTLPRTEDDSSRSLQLICNRTHCCSEAPRTGLTQQLSCTGSAIRISLEAADCKKTMLCPALPQELHVLCFSHTLALTAEPHKPSKVAMRNYCRFFIRRASSRLPFPSLYWQAMKKTLLSSKASLPVRPCSPLPSTSLHNPLIITTCYIITPKNKRSITRNGSSREDVDGEFTLPGHHYRQSHHDIARAQDQHKAAGG